MEFNRDSKALNQNKLLDAMHSMAFAAKHKSDVIAAIDGYDSARSTSSAENVDYNFFDVRNLIQFCTVMV